MLLRPVLAWALGYAPLQQSAAEEEQNLKLKGKNLGKSIQKCPVSQQLVRMSDCVKFSNATNPFPWPRPTIRPIGFKRCKTHFCTEGHAPYLFAKPYDRPCKVTEKNEKSFEMGNNLNCVSIDRPKPVNLDESKTFTLAESTKRMENGKWDMKNDNEKREMKNV